jgi:hypothetical protein
MDRRWRHFAAPVALVASALAWNTPAHARCAIEPPALALSYPDANTEAVPPDAVIWLVPKLGSVRVRLDGSELAPLGDSPAEQFQFQPDEPLGLGEHVLDVRISPIIAGDDSDPVDVQLPFTVADLPYRSGDVEPLEARRLASSGPSPAQPAACAAVTLLSGQCDDILRPAYDWLTFEPIGDPLFYVVGDAQLVGVGCELAAFGVWDAQSVAQYEIAAVLPTGVSEPRVLVGGPSPEPEMSSSAGCAFEPAPRAVGGGSSAIIAASLVLLASRRRRCAC